MSRLYFTVAFALVVVFTLAMTLIHTQTYENHDLRALLIPDVMLKEGEGLFLDDMSLEEMQRRLGCRVIPFDPTPQGCYRALRSLPPPPIPRKHRSRSLPAE